MPENKFQKAEKEVRNKEIIKLYPKFSLEEIAVKYKLTRQRVEQIIKKYSGTVKFQ